MDNDMIMKLVEISQEVQRRMKQIDQIALEDLNYNAAYNRYKDLDVALRVAIKGEFALGGENEQS